MVNHKIRFIEHKKKEDREPYVELFVDGGIEINENRYKKISLRVKRGYNLAKNINYWDCEKGVDNFRRLSEKDSSELERILLELINSQTSS